ncbi:cytidine deaminase [bacterium]|nr:cytidine deaminase [bacterium]
MEYQTLIDKAVEVSKHSYSPYSKFAVGACVLTEDGSVYCGCNFENSSFGLTICAERNAIGSAVADGKRNIKAVAIYSPNAEYCYPCGACRQVMYEFRSESGTDIITTGADGIRVNSLEELLPEGFNL